MTVVTATSGDDVAGCLVGLHTQCSIDPLRYIVCLSHANRTYAVARRAGFLAVHHLQEPQLTIARLFGEETGDDFDKLSRCAWHLGPRSTVVLDDVDHWWVGAVEDRVALGDHDGFVLEPVMASSMGPYRQLGSRSTSRLEAGHPRGT